MLDLITINKKTHECNYCQNLQQKCLTNTKKHNQNICKSQINSEDKITITQLKLQMQKYHQDNVYLNQNAETV